MFFKSLEAGRGELALGRARAPLKPDFTRDQSCQPHPFATLFTIYFLIKINHAKNNFITKLQVASGGKLKHNLTQLCGIVVHPPCLT